MSEHSSSHWPDWNTLTPTFRKSYSLTNERVYSVAGDIWTSALNFALSRNLDASDAREALLYVVGRVSKTRTREIQALHSYLFKAYAHRVSRLLQQQKHYPSLDAINREIASDAMVAQVIEDKVLLGEIVARMDHDLRTIYEGLILGYSFEELAKKTGKPANQLRNKFSRGVKRIARDINPAK